MPKLNLDINGATDGAAEGFEAWAGELPPTGTYSGVMKIAQVNKIQSGANAGAPRVKIGVELRDTEGGSYDGYVAWGGVNLIDSGIPFVNQWLKALTDGSDAEFEAIKKAFYSGAIVDERGTNILKIGKWVVDSPDGSLPVKVSLKQRNFYDEVNKESRVQVGISSFLSGGGSAPKAGSSGPAVSEVVEEEAEDVDADDLLD